MKAETHTGVNEIPLEEGEKKKGKAEKKAGKRIGYNYIIVKSLKEHRKNDVVKCLYIKGLTKWGFCVIKEGTMGDTKDEHGRDIRDRLLWQKELHEKLKGKIRLPKYLDSFEERGNFYLVIEYIKGKSLGSMAKKNGTHLRNEIIAGTMKGKRAISILLQVADILKKLSNEGIVHRDVTGGNFLVTKGGKVAVIDLELSYSIKNGYPTPPFQLGTAGFMSPQQEATKTPTIQEDIFAFGAIVLQVWTGISPSKLTRPPAGELNNRVRFFVSDAILAEMVIRCLQLAPEERPSIDEIIDQLTVYRKDLSKAKARQKSVTNGISRDQILSIAEKGLNTICSPLMAEPEKGWFSPNQNTFREDKHKLDKAYYGSFQFGVSGPMYLFSKVASLGINIDNAKPHIQSGLERINAKYIRDQISTSAGLYFGSSGVAMVLNAVRTAGLVPDQMAVDWIQMLLQRTNDEQSLLNGRAGQGIAVSACSPMISQWDAQARLREDFNFLASLQEANGSWIVPYKKNGKKVIPTFHGGMAGIIYFLLDYYAVSKNENVLSAASRGLNRLMKHAKYRNGKLIWFSSSGKRLNYAWCEGVAGIAFTFLKAYEVTSLPMYRKYAFESLAAIEEEIFDNNLSQCHGLSGLGEVYLEAFKVSGEIMWLKRAEWIAKVILHIKLQHPGYGYYWLVEQEKFPVAGFMTGNSGILHYLFRYCFTEKLKFPLLHKWDNCTIGTKSEASPTIIQNSLV